MNSISNSTSVYMRSLATRDSANEVSEALPEAIHVAKAAGFDLIIAETAGIGQGDSRITDLADISIYVMTSDYGAPSQLEKIDMLDYADIIVVNKFEKKGSDDAIRDIRKQVQRNRKAGRHSAEDFPVYGTIASKFNDDGVTALYHGIIDQLNSQDRDCNSNPTLPRPDAKDVIFKSHCYSGRTDQIPLRDFRYSKEVSHQIPTSRPRPSETSGTLRQNRPLSLEAEGCRDVSGC